MKTKPLLLLVAALLPATTFAAKDGKRPQKSAAGHDGPIGGLFETFDKNGNHRIDADELPALQKAFATLKKLDRNANGEIELPEVERPQPTATGDRRSRMLEHFKKLDRNANHQIDTDEVAGLQKMASGGKIMSRLDRNSNGKLDPDEVAQLNKRLEQSLAGKGPPSAPPVLKAPEKAAESPKPEKKKDEKPAPPAPDGKPPGNFGV